MITASVVIIDSGINIERDTCRLGVSIEHTEKGFIVSDKICDPIGHGTIIYSIINKQIDDNKIFVVKLPHYQEEVNGDSCLIYALEYIKKNVNCRLINISLGVKTGESIDRLYSLCADLTNMGIVIISAFDNDGCYSYPAAFDCVIGVDSNNKIKQIDEFYFVDSSPINILAKGNTQRFVDKNGKNIIVSGSSIACAHITSFMANNLNDNTDLKSSLLFLKSRAKRSYSAHVEDNKVKNEFFEIKNASVFPFAKEAHALVRFSDMLSFNISDYYDIRRSGKVGRKLSDYYEGETSNKLIADVDLIDFTNIDTIILGHLDELNALGHDYRDELIRKACRKKINIYSFDPLEQYTDLLCASNVKFFFPCVTKKDVPQNTFGKLFKIGKPVLGIYGTSSHQGKFSLQLTIKRELESLGYNVGTIGTEPHSLLFNFDMVFPMGYNSAVSISNKDIVMYLNNEINKLCLRGKEIILTSTQAQIVPYYFNNILEVPNMQYFFALGTNPDAIVLCVNHYDEISYIRNSIYALMGLTDSKIIALVVYPITYANNWGSAYGYAKRRITIDEFNGFSNTLKKEFQLPVYMLGNNQDMSDLCQNIIDYF